MLKVLKSKKLRPQKKQNDLEGAFIRRWAHYGGPFLIAQHEFHPSRGWKIDWAHPESRVGIEINGGIWMRKGRHTSGKGYWADRIKINASLRMGWKIFELVPNDLEDESVYREIIDEINRRLTEGIADDIGERTKLGPFARSYAESARDRSRRNRKAPEVSGAV